MQRPASAPRTSVYATVCGLVLGAMPGETKSTDKSRQCREGRCAYGTAIPRSTFNGTKGFQVMRAGSPIGARGRRRARSAVRQNQRPGYSVRKRARPPREAIIAPGFTGVTTASLQAIKKISAQYERQVAQSRKWVKRRLAQIKSCHARGQHRRVSYLEQMLLRSRQLKVVAAARARVRMAWLARNAAKERGTFRPDRRYGPDLAEVIAVADALDVWNPTREKVSVRTEAKNHGGFRAIYMFGLMHRARQEMIRMVLGHRSDLHPAQYAPSRGLKQAQRDILAALAMGKYRYAVTADIRSYFNNIDVGRLPELLRLPAALIEANIDSRNFNINPHQQRDVQREITKYEDMNDEAVVELYHNRSDDQVRLIGSHVYRQYQASPGIPQGSSCSPIIAEMVMADILGRIITVRVIFNWVDDILILAKTREEAERAIETLESALTDARGGPFLAKVKKLPVEDGFDFIGSKFMASERVASVAPTPLNRTRLDRMMRKHLYQISHSGADPAAAIKSLNGWIEANSFWADAGEIKRQYLAEIKRAKLQHGRWYCGRSRTDCSASDYYLRGIGEAFPRPRRNTGRSAGMGSEPSEYPGL